MKIFNVYFGDQCIGTIEAVDTQAAWAKAKFEFRHWCGGYNTLSIELLEG